jgi:hypothetical protein
MTAGLSDRNADRGLRNMAAVVVCLVLTVCAGPPAQVGWVKAGVDDAATGREVSDCAAQANAAQNHEQGVDQDISSTLGRNWAMSYTTSVQDQTMRQQAADLAAQVFSSCMRAKGFKKQG